MGPHYVYQSILFFDRTAGLLTLVSAMFTVTWIQRHNEMTALMAAGISRIRVVKPVIVGGGRRGGVRRGQSRTGHSPPSRRTGRAVPPTWSATSASLCTRRTTARPAC